MLLVVCNRVRGQNPSFSVFPPISCNLIDFSSHGEYQSSEGYDPTYCMILTHSFTLDFVNSNPNLPSFLFLIFSELDFQVSSERKSSPTLILVDNSFCISPNFSLFFVLTLFSFSNCHLRSGKSVPHLTEFKTRTRMTRPPPSNRNSDLPNMEGQPTQTSVSNANINSGIGAIPDQTVGTISSTA